MSTKPRFAGKTAIVTGGANGIGAATATRLASEGAKVVISDLDAVRGTALAETLGGRFVQHDVSDESGWAKLVDDTVRLEGSLDILVNNAGIDMVRDLEDLTLADWRRLMAVNLDGVFIGCREAVKAMKHSGGGAIVNVSSIMGYVAVPRADAYCASKGGVRLLTKSVALYCAEKGYNIRCNSVHPTYIETPMLRKTLHEMADGAAFEAAIVAQIPIKRLGKVEEVAAVIAFLASDDASLVTGSEYLVDGGTTAA